MSVTAIFRFLRRNLMGEPFDEKDAYQVGYRAPEGSKNPYPYGTWDYRKWEKGQEDAEQSGRAW